MKVMYLRDPITALLNFVLFPLHQHEPATALPDSTIAHQVAAIPPGWRPPLRITSAKESLAPVFPRQAWSSSSLQSSWPALSSWPSPSPTVSSRTNVWEELTGYATRLFSCSSAIGLKHRMVSMISMGTNPCSWLRQRTFEAQRAVTSCCARKRKEVFRYGWPCPQRCRYKPADAETYGDQFGSRDDIGQGLCLPWLKDRQCSVRMVVLSRELCLGIKQRRGEGLTVSKTPADRP